MTLGLSPVKAFYAAGDNVTVTATLTFHGGAAVPGTMYTAAQGANGVADNALRTASLYFYGPRAFPKPILRRRAPGPNCSWAARRTPMSQPITPDSSTG